MPGPKKQPTALKILHGNPGKRPLNPDEPQPQGSLPECPDFLQGQAREAWQEFGRELEACGIATRLDATALAMLCNAYAQYLDAAEKTARLGAVWIEKGEGKIPKFQYSPYWSVMNRAFKQVKDMLGEFGMTPSSRSNVSVKEKQTGVARRQRA